MADVTSDRRGQLILITSIVLAVALVGLALVLNSVIFTENLATRNQELESNDVLSERANARGDFARGITAVNENVSTSSEFGWLRENLSSVAATREDRLTRQAGLGGSVVNYSVVSATEGTRIRQTDASRNFTAGDERTGDDDWVVVENVQKLHHFRLSADRGSLFEATISTTKSTLADSAFNVNVTDANGDTWRVYLFQSTLTDTAYLLVEEPAEDFASSGDGYETFAPESCAYSNATVAVWLKADVVQNSECGQLSFLRDDAVRPLTIRYDNAYDEGANAPRIQGTYDLLVDQEISRSPSPFYSASSGNSPFTQQAIVEARIQMHYRSQRSEYYTDIQTEPESPAPAAVIHNPQVDTWVIANDSSDVLGGPEYKMDWAVSDSDGDLDRVELILTEDTNDVERDKVTVDVSGSSASGTATLNRSSLSLGEVYRLEIVVTDEEGGADSDVILDTADGSP